MLKDFSLNKTYQFLLIILAFLMPLTVFGANLIIVIICLIWLFSGNYNSKYSYIRKSKVLMASILFYGIHIIGMIWTEDIEWGLEILHKMWYFLLLFPVLSNIVKKDHVKHYISAFLIAISITEVTSYLVWFQLIEPFKNATIHNPTPFMSHVSYNPILAVAIYIVLHSILFDKNISRFKFLCLSFFSITMTVNMFITGGRAGQVMFFAMIFILIFQYFDKQKIKAIIATIIIVPGIFFGAYQSSEIFHDRVGFAITEVKNYSKNKVTNTSVGLRISFTINSWEVIKDNPFIGVGTGDFPNEYSKVSKINSPSIMLTKNPHNMYILVLVQLGLIGLISFLAIFYYQIKLSFSSHDKFLRNFGLILPLLFLLIMLSDAYLLGHYTTLLYIFFSSFLHKDFEQNK